MRISIRYLTVLLAVRMLAGAAVAEPPPDLGYQGKLLDSAGEALLGPVNLQIRIFDQPSDGTQLYAEDHQGVALQDGVFNVVLGTGMNPQGTFDAQLFAETNRWLEVSVDTEILEPRQPFSSVAYAFQSQASQTAADADTLDGLDATALDQSAHVGDAANPHGVTAAQAGAATPGEVDGSIATHSSDSGAHHAKTESFGELSDQIADAQIPDSITRDTELAGEATARRNGDTALQDQVDALQAQVTALNALLAGVIRNGDTLQFAGMNLQVVNGMGTTETENALGNLIVGYNEDTTTPQDRTGSHNVVVGVEHSYRSHGGLLVGQRNTLSAPFASVSGGRANIASGELSSVGGGDGNSASGLASSVSGGSLNIASGPNSSVSGGLSNTASGNRSSVSGGLSNTASGFRSSVSGGDSNTASGFASSASGGRSNTANGASSSVSGGEFNEARGNYSFIGGGGDQDAGNIAKARHSVILGGERNMTGVDGDQEVGRFSTISGGADNSTTGVSASVSGGNGNTASGSESSVSGGANRSVMGTSDWAAGSLFEDN